MYLAFHLPLALLAKCTTSLILLLHFMICHSNKCHRPRTSNRTTSLISFFAVTLKYSCNLGAQAAVLHQNCMFGQQRPCLGMSSEQHAQSGLLGSWTECQPVPCTTHNLGCTSKHYCVIRASVDLVSDRDLVIDAVHCCSFGRIEPAPWSPLSRRPTWQACPSPADWGHITAR